MSAKAENFTLWHYEPYKNRWRWRPKAFGWDALSDREKIVVTMMASPMSVVDIAKELGIGYKTACTYRYRAMFKLGIKDPVMLAYFLLSRGKIQNPFSGEPNG